MQVSLEMSTIILSDHQHLRHELGGPTEQNVTVKICWPSLSNQCFYRQIAGYGMGVGDHRVG